MELSILHLLQQIHTPWLDSLIVFITRLGDEGIFWIALAVIMLFFKKTRRCGIFVLLSMGICLVVGNWGLKNIIGRPRPFVTDPSVVLKIPAPGEFGSFPSGHTMHGFTAATVIFLHFKKPGIAALLLASLIAFSRMYLFVHYPTDIIGGILVGVCVAVFVVKVIGSKFPSKEKIL